MTPSREQTMTREQIHTSLWKLAAKQFDRDPATLRPEHRIAQDLSADSLDVAELSMGLEEDLGVLLPDDLMGNPNLTLGDVEQVVWEKYSGKK